MLLAPPRDQEVKPRLAGAAWARAALTLLLAVLAWLAFRDEYGSVPLVSGIDLAIHEFGHMLFMPFGVPVLGETMVILGGSLTQLVVPALFTVYFARRREAEGGAELHAASVCLWWCAMSLLSVAIYVGDARAGALMLLTGQTGQESDAHDWNNLLTRWGMLEHDTRIATALRALAFVLCATSIAGGLIAATRRAGPANGEE